MWVEPHGPEERHHLHEGRSLSYLPLINALKRQVVANAAIVPAGVSAAIDVFVTDTAHVIIDTNGYFGQ
jgi:hypothetical protein